MNHSFPKRALGFLGQTVSGFSEDCCMRMGAALAYYTVFALPPIAVLLVLVLSVSFQATGRGSQQEAREVLQQQVTMFVGEGAAKQVATIIQQASLSGGWLAWLLGIAGVIVSATGVVVALQQTLNEVWEVQPDPDKWNILGMLVKRLLSLGIIAGLGIVLVISTMLTTWLSKYAGAASGILAATISFLIVLGLFAVIFKYLPDAIINWSDALVGAAVTTLLFVIGKIVIDIYLAQSQMESQFGAAATLAILLAWIYYTAVILLYGAEFTHVWAERLGGGIRPDPGAIRATRKSRRLEEARRSEQE